MTASSGDLELKNAPSDTISAVNFSNSVPNLLSVTSWDKTVRVYDVGSNELIAEYEHETPVLDSVLIGKEKCYSGGLDGRFTLQDGRNTKKSLYDHDDAIKSIVLTEEKRLFTGSWDKTVKAIDTRASSTSYTSSFDVPEKVYSMSTSKNSLIVGMAERKILVFDLRNMGMPVKRESSLKYQTRCVACFPNGEGYAVSSIEGRVAVEYLDTSAEIQAKKYAFKCHRQIVDGVDAVYPVHTLAFHPKLGTFCSGGGDGFVSVWDGENKKRLRQYSKYPSSISSLSFNCDGTFLAVASSYSYEEGPKEHPKDSVYIKSISDAEFRPKTVK